MYLRPRSCRADTLNADFSRFLAATAELLKPVLARSSGADFFVCPDYIAPLDMASADPWTAATLHVIKIKMGMVPNLFSILAKAPRSVQRPAADQRGT